MSPALAILSRREASIFACLVDTVVDPAAGFPRADHTDAVAFFDEWLTRSPALNRRGLRALLNLLEVGSFARGYRARFRKLDPGKRLRYVTELEHGRLRDAIQPLRALAQIAYYGDDAVMRRLGYSADDVVARGRELRMAEARW